MRREKRRCEHKWVQHFICLSLIIRVSVTVHLDQVHAHGIYRWLKFRIHGSLQSTWESAIVTILFKAFAPIVLIIAVRLHHWYGVTSLVLHFLILSLVLVSSVKKHLVMMRFFVVIYIASDRVSEFLHIIIVFIGSAIFSLNSVKAVFTLFLEHSFAAGPDSNYHDCFVV